MREKMVRLWKYEDYVGFLSHENTIVREWAFDAIENQYSNQYTDEVSRLISDENSHLASAAPRYLARHKAVQHGPAILNSFMNDSGNIPSNCISALAKMEYEPAMETIVDSLTSDLGAGSFYAILDYLGSIPSEIGRETLISAAMQIKDQMHQCHALFNLLRHNQPNDIQLILDIILKPVKKSSEIDPLLIEAIAEFWGASHYFKALSGPYGKSIMKDPGDVLDSFFKGNSHLVLGGDARDNLERLIHQRQCHDLVTALMFEVQTSVRERYSDKELSPKIQALFNKDRMGVFLFEALSKQPSMWNEIEAKTSVAHLVCFVLSVYFSIVERNAYIKALSPEAGIPDLIRAVKNAGPELPGELSEEIVKRTPVSELKASLSDGLTTWGDNGIVKLMGRIGKKEFVPDLLRVLNDADTLDIIYSDAIAALNALDEAADELILNAVQNREIDDWDVFSLLEHLPYSEAFDLVSEIWGDENSEMDFYENFAYCLRGIGDVRGIEVLRDIYNTKNNAGYIGELLECLSLLHNVDIPELPVIRERRRDEKQRQALRQKEFGDIFKDMANIKNKGRVVPFQRESKKVGRNDPCPCGSGKKYKKCCLNKS